MHFGSRILMSHHIHTIETISYLLGDPKIEAVRGELLPRELRIGRNRFD